MIINIFLYSHKRYFIYKNIRISLILCLIIAPFILVLHAPDSLSDTLTVTNVNDGGAGSLRHIIDNVAQPGDDIVFAPSLAGETINLTSGQYFIDIDLTITGPGLNPITIDANNNSRIFEISGGANLELSYLVMTNGYISGSGPSECGGAILATNGASFEIHGLSFINNKVEVDECDSDVCSAEGGAIAMLNASEGTVRQSLFFGNSASADCSRGETICIAFGGAISNQGGDEDLLSVENSTICDSEVRCSGSSCLAAFGGASFFEDPPGLLNNNTFSKNIAVCNSEGCMLLSGSTIEKQNHPTTTVELLNNIIHNDPGIIAQNCNSEGLPAEGLIIDGGNNLQFPDASCGDTIPVANAMLEPLAFKGGITQTKAITQESPAYNSGNNETCRATDQRGITRPQGPICDIGAFKLIVKNVPTIGG